MRLAFVAPKLLLILSHILIHNISEHRMNIVVSIAAYVSNKDEG